MTTSFAHFVRGQIPSALRANVTGTLLATCCAVLAPWCLASAWYGVLWRVRDPSNALMWALLALLGISLVEWGLRLSLR
jgi:hypothetical protein